MPYSREVFESLSPAPATALPKVAVATEAAVGVEAITTESSDDGGSNSSLQSSSIPYTGSTEKHDRKTEKKCIKCKRWLLLASHFGVHNTSNDGFQSICKDCKKEANKKAQTKNVVARIRHHTATRCLEQLKGHVPSGFTKMMESYLGYPIQRLVRHLRDDLHAREGDERSLKDALNEGYHIDHIKPLSSYKVIVDGQVDWDAFKQCWRIENLSAIPARENLVKGAKFDPEDDHVSF